MFKNRVRDIRLMMEGIFLLISLVLEFYDNKLVFLYVILAILMLIVTFYTLQVMCTLLNIHGFANHNELQRSLCH